MNGKFKVIKSGSKGGSIKVTIKQKVFHLNVVLRSPVKKTKFDSVLVDGMSYDVLVNGRDVSVDDYTYGCENGEVHGLAPAAAVVAVAGIAAFTYLADKMIDKMENVDDFSVSVTVGDMALSVQATDSGTNQSDDSGKDDSKDDKESDSDDDGGDGGDGGSDSSDG